MAFFLKSIQLSNFRCYDSESVSFRPDLTLITGENDGGKTALLTAIKLLFDSKSQPSAEDFRHADGASVSTTLSIEGVLERGGKATRIRRCYLLEEGHVKGGELEVLQKVPRDPRLRDALEKWGSKGWKAQDEKDLLAAYDIEWESNSPKRTHQFEELVAGVRKEDAWVIADKSLVLPEVDLYGPEDRDDPQGRIEKLLRSALNDHFSSAAQSKQYAAIQDEMKEEADRQLEQIGEIFGRYDHRKTSGQGILQASPDVNLSKGFYLENLQINYHGHWTPLENLGAAKRRKLELALLEWDRQQRQASEGPSRLLLYDEPDLHFDYAGQRRMSELLRAIAAKERTQIIVATHSLNLIDRVKLESIAYLQHDPAGDLPTTTIHEPGDWSEISSLAGALGVRNHIILNACLLLVEGPTEEILIPYFFLQSRGYQLAAIGVELLQRGPSDRGGGYDPAWRLCSHVLRNNRKAFLLLDRDTKTDKNVTPEMIESLNQEVGQRCICETKNLAFVGQRELEDELPHDVLQGALMEYCKAYKANRNPNADLPDKKQIGELLNHSRERSESEQKGMSKIIGEELGHGYQISLSKGKLAANIKAELTSYEAGWIPPSLEAAFELLEDYSGAPYGS